MLPVRLGGIDGLRVYFVVFFFSYGNCLLTTLELSGSSNCLSFCLSFIIVFLLVYSNKPQTTYSVCF